MIPTRPERKELSKKRSNPLKLFQISSLKKPQNLEIQKQLKTNNASRLEPNLTQKSKKNVTFMEGDEAKSNVLLLSQARKLIKQIKETSVNTLTQKTTRNGQFRALCALSPRLTLTSKLNNPISIESEKNDQAKTYRAKVLSPRNQSNQTLRSEKAQIIAQTVRSSLMESACSPQQKNKSDKKKPKQKNEDSLERGGSLDVQADINRGNDEGTDTQNGIKLKMLKNQLKFLSQGNTRGNKLSKLKNTSTQIKFPLKIKDINSILLKNSRKNNGILHTSSRDYKVRNLKGTMSQQNGSKIEIPLINQLNELKMRLKKVLTSVDEHSTTSKNSYINTRTQASSSK